MALQFSESRRERGLPDEMLTFDSDRIFDAAMSGHRSAGPHGANLGSGLVRAGKYKIHVRRIGWVELIPVLTAQPLSRVIVVSPFL